MGASQLILAIETSCDETAAAVVTDDFRVLSSIVASQASLHAQWGGVVPEVASREHVTAITGTVAAALSEAAVRPDRMNAIAVTVGPGLPGSLSVGVVTAKALALAWNRPLVAVNHLEGHLFSAELDGADVAYPAVYLLVSGGHCILAHAPERGVYEVLGTTRDDSVGEAYDKVARELGLGYPGGPVLDRLAGDGKDMYALPRPMLGDGYDFSFSGLKTAVRRTIERGGVDVPNLAASFATACMDVLLGKLERAVDELSPRSAVVVGGVAASPILRDRLRTQLGNRTEVRLPDLRYATDNAAMIGAAGWWQLQQTGPSPEGFGVRPHLPLGTNAAGGV